MNHYRQYSTIGIEGFVCGPSDPLPSSYLRLSPPSSEEEEPSSPQTSSFTSWEITGVVKERPEDFVVREILPKDDERVSRLLSQYDTATRTNDTPSTTSQGGDDAVLHNDHQRNVATMPSRPPIRLPSISNESPNESKSNPNESELTGEPPRKKMIAGETIPSRAQPTRLVTLPESISGDAPASAEISLDKTIERYIENVATPEHSGTELLNSIAALSEKATSRFPTGQNDNGAPVTAIQASDGTKSESDAITEVWIPPLHLSETNGNNDTHTNTNDGVSATGGAPVSEAEIRAQRKAFHKAIRIVYPFLNTESSAYPSNGHDASSLKSASSSSQPPNESAKNNSGDHWIKIKIDDSFDELIDYLFTPREDLRQLFLFRNRGFEGASQPSKSTTTTSVEETKPTSSVVLQLRPGVSKDDRRKVHHIIALKNKHFETSIRQQGVQKKNGSKPRTKETEDKSETVAVSAATTDLVVTWKKQALRKGWNNKNKKRKRFENDKESNSDYKNTHANLLCVLKKSEKEHLTAMQILSRSLRCRQADIGFAGIKDMKAITYQFVTLRNMGLHRAERAIQRQLQKRDVELKILCSNVDFVLNIGDLEGNQFEITVRNVKRVKVDQVPHCINKGILEPAKESFVDCDAEHIDRMVERIQQHGFINFYGEQRIGAPGSKEEVGVRAFEIGRAMLRQDFMGAINLLMEGTRHNETDEARRVRQAWKDSNGNPSITLKAFKGADIMPRERAILRGLNRYPENPLEAIRFLAFNMRVFYVHAYQSYIFNRIASRRVKLYGETVVKGDLYFDKGADHRDEVKIVQGNEVPPIAISQVVLPLPGHNIQYPTNEIGQLYRELLETDNVNFEEKAVPEATARGSYRKLIVYPRNLSAEIESSGPNFGSMKLSFQLPKGSYATMLLRELMLTTVVRLKTEKSS